MVSQGNRQRCQQAGWAHCRKGSLILRAKRTLQVSKGQEWKQRQSYQAQNRIVRRDNLRLRIGDFRGEFRSCCIDFIQLVAGVGDQSTLHSASI